MHRSRPTRRKKLPCVVNSRVMAQRCPWMELVMIYIWPQVISWKQSMWNKGIARKHWSSYRETTSLNSHDFVSSRYLRLHVIHFWVLPSNEVVLPRSRSLLLLEVKTSGSCYWRQSALPNIMKRAPESWTIIWTRLADKGLLVYKTFCNVYNLYLFQSIYTLRSTRLFMRRAHVLIFR